MYMYVYVPNVLVMKSLFLDVGPSVCSNGKKLMDCSENKRNKNKYLGRQCPCKMFVYRSFWI